MAKVGQFRESPTCVVGPGVNSDRLCIELYDRKNRLWRNSPAWHGTILRDRPKHWPIVNCGHRLPPHEGSMGPDRNRNAPNAPMFAHEVGDEPSSVAFLNMSDVQVRELGAT